jgi:hypothetical protein
MAKRRKVDSFGAAVAVAQLFGLVLVLGMFVPKFREQFLNFGSVFIKIIIVVGAIGLGIGLFYAAQKFLIKKNVNRTEASENGSGVQLHNGANANGSGSSSMSAEEFTEQLRNIDWFQFERIMALLYRKLGYTVTRRGGANPDGGVDLVIEKDGQRIALQCKQWKTWNVGVKVIREFLGALTDTGFQKGMVLTLCGYTSEAREFAQRHGIEILDQADLAKLIRQVELYSDREAQEVLSDTRKYCPKCESEMVLRTATKGIGAGRQFWGCSAYPKCRFTMPV